MIDFAGRGIVLDIEGTTSSIRFVYDILFPFARHRADDFLRRRWEDPAVQKARRQIEADAGANAWEQPQILAEAFRLMDGDVKATGLKALQGLIWEEGYAAGLLRSHVYADVPLALADWRARGLDIRIYSSGSVHAQKSFFGKTEYGDLRPFLQGHYDTTTGPKREPESYARIALDMGMAPDQLLFLSDVPAELDAAASAGWRTGLAVRPGNAAVAADCRHAKIETFDEVNVRR